MDDIAGFDLNLLTAFDALLRERSVSLAARRLGLGQPAMSHHLARLRKMLDDDVLVRAGGAMVPTARALAMEPEVRAILRRIHSVLGAEQVFDPVRAELEFRLGVTDSVEAILVPAIAAALASAAPGVRLRLVAVEEGGAADGLDSDRFDLAVGVFAGGRNHHKRRVIYRDDFQAVYNPRLVTIEGDLSLADYGRYPLLIVKPGTADPLLQGLRKKGLVPRATVFTPRLMSAPFIAQRTPLIATVHTQVARLFAENFDLVTRPVPPGLGLPPALLVMLWHAASDHLPAHQWMRDLVLSSLEGMRRETERGAEMQKGSAVSR
ncbi:LysR family transcriptional regulator [Rhizobium paknamense]|uniref:DNA-binding transcriptional LysR family regulator n=1 Tax=Rhizobium paknamense TaxID=1206817 RepID=A0ABU0IIU7_9HYPH|nr:LysR family transcriptional regulator [Rhizobium paknamense]MDQ0458188.1 DNA-binding transcriptional LysR family regulator [Rhizobium paknamense]